MKKFLLVLVLISFGFTAIKAQTTPTTTTSTAKPTMEKTGKPKPAPLEVPDVVKNKFAADYPTIKDAKWQKSGNADFAAVYKEGGKNRRIVYSADGNVVRTRIDVDASALPGGANDYITKTYPNDKVTSATQVTEKGKTWYEVKAGENKLKFDSNGNAIVPKKQGAKKMDAPAPK